MYHNLPNVSVCVELVIACVSSNPIAMIAHSVFMTIGCSVSLEVHVGSCRTCGIDRHMLAIIVSQYNVKCLVYILWDRPLYIVYSVLMDLCEYIQYIFSIE